MKARLGSILIAAVFLGQVRDSRVTIDGEFDDWNAVPVSISAPTPHPAGFGIRQVRITGDSGSLWMLFELTESILLSRMPAPISIAIDLDASAVTGRMVGSLSGVDAVIDIAGTRNVQVRRIVTGMDTTTSGPPFAHRIEIAPIHESSRLEMVVSRSNAFLSTTSARIQVSVDRGDGSSIELPAVDVSLPPWRGISTDAWTIERPRETEFRVCVWNTAEAQYTNDQAHDRRVAMMRAIDADLWLLTEVTRHPTELERQFGGSQRDVFRVLQENGGGLTLVNRGSLTAAKRRVEYPPEGLAALLSTMPAETRAGRLETFERRPPTSASIGIARTRAGQVLAMPVHLDSANLTALGTLQAQTLRSAALELKRSRNLRGLIIGGDLNLFGPIDRLRLLQDQLDLDESSLAAVPALRPDRRSATTTRYAPTGSAIPGRMDWLLYSDSSLELLKSFVLDTAQLPDHVLRRYGLLSADSDVASDHLPVVADFRAKRAR